MPRRSDSPKRRWSRILTASTIALALLFALPIVAATVLRLDLKGLTAASDAVVHGDVQSVQSRIEDGRVFTYTDIAVHEALKGKVSDVVQLRQLGGETDTLATWVAGMPRFTQGEEVLVFLEDVGDGDAYVVTGMMQGKFKVVVGPDGLKKHVVPYLGDLTLVEPIPDDGRAIQPAKPSQIYRTIHDFDAFTERIRVLSRASEDRP